MPTDTRQPTIAVGHDTVPKPAPTSGTNPNTESAVRSDRNGYATQQSAQTTKKVSSKAVMDMEHKHGAHKYVQSPSLSLP